MQKKNQHYPAKIEETIKELLRPSYASSAEEDNWRKKRKLR